MKQSADKYDLTIQIGDFGAGFGAEQYLDSIDSEKVKILAGNHDCYETLARYPHNLGRFGQFEFHGKNIFFVCGAWSIDRQFRIEGLSWWPSEELTLKESMDCLDMYEACASDIDIMITHDAPANIQMAMLNTIGGLGGSTYYQNFTGEFLYEAWKIHEPKEWYYGHWHKPWSKQVGNTNFRCLAINEEMIIEI